MNLNKIDDEFKNDLKDTFWDNISSLDDIFADFGFHLIFSRVNMLLDEHVPNHKFSEKEMSLKAKWCRYEWSLWKNATGYLNAIAKKKKKKPTLKVAKHKKI